jgi:hypothetical protein
MYDWVHIFPSFPEEENHPGRDDFRGSGLYSRSGKLEIDNSGHQS